MAGKANTQVEIEYKAQKTEALTFAVADARPGIFTWDSSGKGQGLILNEDGSLNSASNPAASFHCRFLRYRRGQTDPGGVDGKPATDALPKPRLQVSVTIGGQEADVLYAGAAPGLVAGATQVNPRISSGAASGSAVAILLTVGNMSSPPGVTMAVR